MRVLQKNDSAIKPGSYLHKLASNGNTPRKQDEGEHKESEGIGNT